MYNDVQIGFSQQHLDKHIQKYYIIRDLKELELQKKPSAQNLGGQAQSLQSARSINTGQDGINSACGSRTFKERREMSKKRLVLSSTKIMDLTESMNNLRRHSKLDK